MREAIITIVEPATDTEPEHTKLFRVQFAGDFGIIGEDNNTDSFEFKNVVDCERLAANELPGSVPQL